MFLKTVNLKAQDSAKASAKHSQVKKLEVNPALLEESKEEGEKDVRNFKRNIQAQIGALTGAVKHKVDKKQVKNPVEAVDNDYDNLKRELERLFVLHYHNVYSMLVRLGKLHAKRERIACYYANNDISKEDYASWVEYFDLLEDEINGIPPKEAHAINAIILCRTPNDFPINEISLKAQEKRLKGYCKDKNINVISIKNLCKSNKSYTVLDAILDYINGQKGTVALVCDSVNRLLRSREDYNKINKLRREGKLELHFVRDNLVLSKQSNSNVLLKYGLIIGMGEKLAG